MIKHTINSLVFFFAILFIGLLFCPFNCFSQKNDPNWKTWQNEKKPDTIRFKAIDDFIWDNYLFDKPDSAIYYATLAYQFAVEVKNIKLQAVALNTKGTCYYIKDDFKTAIDIYLKSLKKYKQINNKQGLAAIANNLGNIYKEQGDLAKAIDSYVLSLKMADDMKDTSGMATGFNNIGILYAEQDDYETAIIYYKKAIRLRKKIKDFEGISGPINNIGNVYESQKKYYKALECYNRSLVIDERNKNMTGAATSIGNIAGVYKALGDENKTKDPNKSKMYYKKSFDLSQQVISMSKNIGDNTVVVTAHLNLALLYEIEGNSKEAIEYAVKALQIAQDIGAISYIRDAAEVLYSTYKKKGQLGQSLEMYELFSEMNDSILSIENQDEIIRQEYKYKYEKQAAADSVLQAKEKEITNVRFKQERTQRFALYGGLLLLIIFALFIFNRYKVTYRQKEIISVKEQEAQKQKTLLEIKNKEITDSITYAKRIQSAILPPAKIVKEYLRESFILYKPRDIVAGDFYWMEQIPDGLIFAAADCTGHGVPGAMVSVVCNNALNRSVREYGLTDPGKILDKTRELIISEFEQSEDDMKDGMDISLCVLEFEPVIIETSSPDRNHIKLKWSGANNPLWILRNNEIIEFKGNKQPIGMYVDPQPFTTHEIDLCKDDIIYIFTDGYQDQFGGPSTNLGGKKIKTSKMKELFLSISEKPMDEQRIAIDKMFEDWKGNHDQVDDVCVIGVRI